MNQSTATRFPPKFATGLNSIATGVNIIVTVVAGCGASILMGSEAAGLTILAGVAWMSSRLGCKSSGRRIIGIAAVAGLAYAAILVSMESFSTVQAVAACLMMVVAAIVVLMTASANRGVTGESIAIRDPESNDVADLQHPVANRSQSESSPTDGSVITPTPGVTGNDDPSIATPTILDGPGIVDGPGNVDGPDIVGGFASAAFGRPHHWQRTDDLTTFAAGAAHELATPLSTIDVAIHELSRRLRSRDASATDAFNVDADHFESVDKDLALIDGELDRCRRILNQMRGGLSVDETGEHGVRISDLIDESLENVREPHRVVVIDPPTYIQDAMLQLPLPTVGQAIRNLIHNALDATDSRQRIHVQVEMDHREVRIDVIDAGIGMDAQTMDQITKPYFSTKPAGRGIGLGLYLAQSVAVQVDGRLEFESSPGRGTTARMVLPRNRNVDRNHGADQAFRASQDRHADPNRHVDPNRHAGRARLA